MEPVSSALLCTLQLGAGERARMLGGLRLCGIWYPKYSRCSESVGFREVTPVLCVLNGERFTMGLCDFKS